MTRLFLVLLTSLAHAQLKDFCPASCLVCSEDVIICQRLTYVIDPPLTAKALIFTDGNIDSVDNGTFSYLPNMTLLGLSNNIIATIEENAFQNLTFLKTLLLDHNQIHSCDIQDTTFTQLPKLETLQLGNNILQSIDGSWFKDLRNLVNLQLEGNRISRLDWDTFANSSLGNLETLDLSDNLITYVAKNSFVSLPRLRRLDLSRNQLTVIPDAFSYLSWLSALNLDINQWNCTCELKELSEFLSSYIQNPDKILYNGKRLICQSTDNPAVQTILQLTESNCVPPNENININIKYKDFSQYKRDISLTGIFCFLGAIGLELTLLYCIYHKLKRNKSKRHGSEEEIVSASSTVADAKTPQCTFTEDNEVQILSIVHPGSEPQLMQPNRTGAQDRTGYRQRGIREMATSDRAEMKPARLQHYFACLNCNLVQSVSGQADGNGGIDNYSSVVLQNGRRIATNPSHQERQTQREEMQRDLPQHALRFNEDFIHQSKTHCQQAGKNQEMLTNCDGDPQEQRFSYNKDKGQQQYSSHLLSSSTNKPPQSNTMPDGLRTSGRHRELQDNYLGQPKNIHSLPDYLTINCVHCHTTYEYRREGSKEGNSREEKNIVNTPEPVHRKKQFAMKTKLYRERNHDNTHHPIDFDKDVDVTQTGSPRIKLAQVSKTVTFNLPVSDVHLIAARKKKSYNKEKTKSDYQDNDLVNNSLKTIPNIKDKERPRSSSGRTPKREKVEKGSSFKKHKHRVQSNSLLKVKINLNPIRKNRINPNKKASEADMQQEQVKEEATSTTATKDKSPQRKRHRDKIDKDVPVPSQPKETLIPQAEKKKKKRSKKTPINDDNLSKAAPENNPCVDQSAEEQVKAPKRKSTKMDEIPSSPEKGSKDAMSLSVSLKEMDHPQKEDTENGEDYLKDNINTDNRNECQTSSLELQKEVNAEDRLEETPQDRTSSNRDQTPSRTDLKTEHLNDTILEVQMPTEEPQKNEAQKSDILQPSTEEMVVILPSEAQGEGLTQELGLEQLPAKLTQLPEQEESDSKEVSSQQQQTVNQDPTPTKADQHENVSENELAVENKTAADGTDKHDGSQTQGGSQDEEPTVTNAVAQVESIHESDIKALQEAGNAGLKPAQNELDGSSSERSALTESQTDLPSAKPESGSQDPAEVSSDRENHSNNNSTSSSVTPVHAEDTLQSTISVIPTEAGKDLEDLPASSVSILQEYVPSGEGSPKRKIRLILPEKTSNRPQTALDKKIR